jgi:hypothetical protein
MYAYAKGSEAHRVAGISWGKFNRLLCIEMNLHPNERMESLNFLKMFRVELDRLIEQSPPIPENVIKDFNEVFKGSDDVIKPEITGILQHTKVYTDTNSRLKRIAAEATINLHYKRGIIKQLVADDIELKTRQVAIDAAKEVAREIIEKEKEKQRSKPVSTNSFIEKQKEERAKEIQSILKSKAGTVSELRNMFNKRHSSIDSSTKEKDATTITINEEPTITIINDDKNDNSLNTTENQDIVETETIIKEDNTIYDKI